jgi:dTDP-glucose 4,6-dehydratase
MSKKILITGGAGFIGHHIVEHLLKNTDWEIDVLDRLTYASSGFDRLRDIEAYDSKRVHIFTADFVHDMGAGLRAEIGEPDYVVHLAAETHVDNSITDPWPFVQSNVVGTFRILEWARTLKRLDKLIYFSTDEVFGPAAEGVFHKEWDAYNSTNPYSATKAGGEELCLAWANTFKVPVFTTHTMNVIGERQHPEKFVPMVVRCVLRGDKILVHANPQKTKSGSRFYIHARNVASAILFLLERGRVRDKYNIVGEEEITNERMVQMIGEILGRTPNYELVDFHSSRPGHDLRYALSGEKMRSMGWTPPKNFRESLEQTIRWIVRPDNRRWLELSSSGLPQR